MGVTNELTDLIIAKINSPDCADWLALLPGGLFPEDEIPDCAPGSPAYGGWGYVGVKDDRTGSELRDEYWAQFEMYGDVKRSLNNAWDACFDCLDSSFYDLKDIGFNIRFKKDRGAPGFPPMKNDKKDRFSRFVCMAQFRLLIQKICTTT